MKLLHIAAGLCWILLSACAGSPASRDLRAALDAQLETNATRYGIPAQSIIVLHNGEVLYRNQTGLADIETRRAVRASDIYAAYSVSKLFVSTLIFQQVDQGRLDLEVPVGRYLPNLPPAWRDVRLDQLLDHSSGLPDFFDGANPASSFPPTTESLLRALADQPLQFKPGTETRYTQTNFVLLAAVLERLHGMPYREIVRTRITQPLGLKNTYLGLAHAPAGRLVTPYRGDGGRLVRDQMIPWQEYSIAHAELFTTADDLGVFLTAVARGKFARPEILLKLWRPYRLKDGQAGPFASGWDYGESAGYTEVGHDGGVKVRVRLLFRKGDLRDHYVIVYLTNGTRDNTWTRILVDSVQSILFSKGLAKGVGE
jgi:D-alanyl-D-alanine carboxypeptidase